MQLAVYGLGSCAVLILFSRKRNSAALAHVLLPGRAPAGEEQVLPGKYAESAAHHLADSLGDDGSLKAALVGGARLFQGDAPVDRSVGVRNVESLRECLKRRGIPVLWEETGGDAGRTVRFEFPKCVLKVRTLRGGWRVLSDKNNPD